MFMSSMRASLWPYGDIKIFQLLKKKKKKKLAVKFLDLIFHNNFLSSILAKCVRDEKYSGTSPPTSPNGSNILDATGSSVLRCTL